MDFLISLLPTIEHFRFLGYWIILLVSLLESLAFIGIAVPGTIFIILAGFVSAKGFLDLGGAIWFAAAGAIIGDTLSYYLGNHMKKFFRAENRILKSRYLKKGERFFNKYGGGSVFLGRFVGTIRPIIPFVAGMFKMDKKKFLSWNIFSGFAWAVIFISLGFFFGQMWQTIVLWSTRASALAAALVAFMAILYIFKRLAVKEGRPFFYFLSSVQSSIKEAAANNPDIRKFSKKHARLVDFASKRLDRKKFFGLPATLLALAFIYVFFLLAGVAEDIITADVITAADERAANLLAVFRSAPLTEFFLWITMLGKWQVVLIFTLAAVVLLWLWRKKSYIIPLLLSVAGSEIFTHLGKIAFQRPRPEAALLAEHSFSFPSGHASNAVAFYGFLVYALIRNSERWKTRVNLFFAASAVILLIGFSRLYLGVHYVSDVWGGYLTGALWLIISISVSEWLLSKEKKSVPFLPTKKTYIISIIILTSASFLYFEMVAQYTPKFSQKSIPTKKIACNIEDVFPNEKLKYTETLTGERQEPISLIIFADNDEKIISSFNSAGWFLSEKISVASVIKTVKAAALKQPYSNAPITPSFWNAKTHSFGFEKPTQSNNVRKRHHARIWKTDCLIGGKQIYVGTASLDTSIKWGITHKIDPNIDAEKESLFSDLNNAGNVKSFREQNFTKPAIGKNFTGDLFFTNGQAYIITF